MLDNATAAEALADACDATRRLFPDRYSQEQNWDDEKVHEILGRRCFPLHPVTTAILCAAQLREVTDPRGVLGFILPGLDKRQDEPALLQSGAFNWIHATALVDWFGEMLTADDDQWRQYQSALRTSRAEVEGVPREYSQVLQAMLLHTVARLKVGRGEGEFARNLSLLCGLSKEECKAALHALAEGGFIRPPSEGGIYTFWPLGEDGSKVERELHQALEEIGRDREKMRATLQNAIEHWGRKSKEVSHGAGHAQDWAADSWLLPKMLLSAEKLREIVKVFAHTGQRGFVEAPRGYVLRLFAANEEEAIWLRANAATLLDEALLPFGDAPPPVVVALPLHATPDLTPLLLRERILQEWKRDREKVKSLGDQAFAEALKRAGDDIEKVLAELSQSNDFVVPAAYRAAMDARRIEGQNRHLANVLTDLYEAAYRRGVPAFFTQYKSDANSLRPAVMLACKFLTRNSMSGYQDAAQNQGVARELRAKFLEIGGGAHWGLLEVSGRLREPQNARVAEAWKVLDETIPPGADEVLVRPAIVKLLNAPYGYDYNTVALLFSAWFGFHSHGLKVSNHSGRPFSIEECFLADKPKPSEFVWRLFHTDDIRLARRDDEGWNAKIDALLSRERRGENFSLEEAEDALAQWREYSQDKENDPAKAATCLRAAERLASDMSLAQAYSLFLDKARDLAQSPNAVQLEVGLKQLKELKEPPPLGKVSPREGHDLEALREQTRAQVSRTAEQLCARFEKLSSVHSYSEQKAKLERTRKLLEEAGESGFLPRVREAQSNLDECERRLTSAGKDAEFVARLKNLRRENRLSEVRAGLQEICEYSPHVEATQTLMDETRALLEETQEKARAAVCNWETRLGEITERGDASRLKNEVQRSSERYDGTPESARLSELERRGEKLEKYLEALTERRRERPTNNKELARLARRLEDLSDDDDFSFAQKQLAADAKSSLDARVQNDVQEAVAWLENAEAQNAQNADAVRLMIELDKGRAFLPDEYSPRLKSLKSAAQKRIDDDELKRVEASFRKIKDKAKRNECLKILQAIVDEN